MTGALQHSQIINGLKISTYFTSTHVVLSKQEIWLDLESWDDEDILTHRGRGREVDVSGIIFQSITRC